MVLQNIKSLREMISRADFAPDIFMRIVGHDITVKAKNLNQDLYLQKTYEQQQIQQEVCFALKISNANEDKLDEIFPLRKCKPNIKAMPQHLKSKMGRE